MIGVLFRSVAEYKDVVDIREGERQTPEDCVDESLKGLSGVAEAKWHSQELKQPKRCDYGRLGNVGRFYGDLVERLDEVHFAEDLRAL